MKRREIFISVLFFLLGTLLGKVVFLRPVGTRMAEAKNTQIDSPSVFNRPEKNNFNETNRINERHDSQTKDNRLSTSEATVNSSPPTSHGNSIDQGIIKNEYVLSFTNKEEMKNFIEIAESNGALIMDRFEHWNTIRLYTRSEQSFRKMVKLSSSPPKHSLNYFVRTPDLPDIPQSPPKKSFHSGAYIPFGNNSLSWLGKRNAGKFSGEDITVAVLDTGVILHDTFAKGAVTQIDILGNPDSPSGDYSGHGTAVASIIAGNSQNTPGVAPKVDILSVRVLDGNGEGDTFTLARGIIEAVNNGADVINLSLGGFASNHFLERAIKYAVDREVILVAAVGNDGQSEVTYPARYPDVIAVTGIDTLEQHPSFANTGDVDFAAPAIGVASAAPDNLSVNFTGTSAAAPFISGIIAGILSETENFSREDIKEFLSKYSNDVGIPGWDPEFGNGVPDIGRLENKDLPEIYDLSLLSPQIDNNTGEDDKINLIISMQNQGTEILYDSVLTFLINDEMRRFEFPKIDINETVSQNFTLDRNVLEKAGIISLTTTAETTSVLDVDQSNNTRSSSIFLHKSPIN